MKKLALLLSIALLWPACASAADLAALKAPAVPVPFSCTNGCAYVGAGIGESGGSFNIVSTGVQGLTDNNLNIFGEAGYDWFSGNIYLGANVMAEYGVVQNGIIPGGGNSSLWGAGAWAKIGYNVASVLGLTPPTATNPLSSLLATTTPYIDLGIWDRPWGSGFLSGAGAMGWISSTTSLHVDYLHVNFNNAAVNSNVNQQTEDMVIGGVDYHFAL